MHFTDNDNYFVIITFLANIFDFVCVVVIKIFILNFVFHVRIILG